MASLSGSGYSSIGRSIYWRNRSSSCDRVSSWSRLTSRATTDVGHTFSFTRFSTSGSCTVCSSKFPWTSSRGETRSYSGGRGSGSGNYAFGSTCRVFSCTGSSACMSYSCCSRWSGTSWSRYGNRGGQFSTHRRGSNSRSSSGVSTTTSGSQGSTGDHTAIKGGSSRIRSRRSRTSIGARNAYGRGYTGAATGGTNRTGSRS